MVAQDRTIERPVAGTPQQERELAAAREINEELLAFARMLDSVSPWPGFFH
jgi:hypothetical protein